MYQIEWERAGDGKRVSCVAVRAARTLPRFSLLICKFPPTEKKYYSASGQAFVRSESVCVPTDVLYMHGWMKRWEVSTFSSTIDSYYHHNRPASWCYYSFDVSDEANEGSLQT